MYLKEGASESLGLLLRWGQDHGHESNSRSQVHARAFEACRGVEIMMYSKGCRKQRGFSWKKIHGVLRLKWHRMLRRWLYDIFNYNHGFQSECRIINLPVGRALSRSLWAFWKSCQLLNWRGHGFHPHGSCQFPGISWYFQWSSVVHPQKFRMMSLSSELTKLTAERLGRNPFCETIIEAVMQVLQ